MATRTVTVNGIDTGYTTLATAYAQEVSLTPDGDLEARLGHPTLRALGEDDLPVEVLRLGLRHVRSLARRTLRRAWPTSR